jgi:hypothetical protein
MFIFQQFSSYLQCMQDVMDSDATIKIFFYSIFFKKNQVCVSEKSESFYLL